MYPRTIKPQGAPCPLRPNRYGGFTVLGDGEYAHTLAYRLTPCVDRIRDLNTRFGVRPYIVRIVSTRWSSGYRDLGTEEVVSSIHILPTPKVDLDALNAMDNRTILVGSEEFGQVRLTEISSAFTEDQLMGRGGHGEQIESDINFYYEFEFPNADGSFPGVKRRFEVAGTPVYKPEHFAWEVELVRAGENRTRDGTPED